MISLEKTTLKNHLKLYLYFFIMVLYMELVLKLFTCKTFFDTGLIFMPLFTLCESLVFKTICSLFSKKVNYILTTVITVVLFILFGTQAVYHGFFDKFLIFFSLTAGGADQVITDGILKSTIDAIVSGIPAMLLLCVPLVLFIIFAKKKLDFSPLPIKAHIINIVAATLAHVLILGAIYLSPSDKFLYFGTFDPNLTVKSFGLIRTEILDIKYNIFAVQTQGRELSIQTHCIKNKKSKENPHITKMKSFHR